jgi:anti-sigma regulatory factor (Ser/Thr protein kinase)
MGMAVAAPERLIYEYSVSNGEFSTVGTETSKLKRALLSIGFPPEASRRALIVAYELAMNVVIHASQGTVSTFWKDGALEIVVTDTGPGIADIEMAMTEGYSTAPTHVKEMGYGAGMGLPNAKACSDSMEIISKLGKG